MSTFINGRKKKQCRDAYSQSVFIDFVERHQHLAAVNYPDSFEAELDIVNNVTFAKSLARRRLIHRNKLGGYSATREGRKLIDPEYVAFYRFCSPYVDVCDFEQEREQHREESFCAAMWSVLLREMHRRMQKGDFPAVCNLHRDIARLYELEQCNEQAAYHFVTALYIQYSGLPYYKDLLLMLRGAKKESTVRDSFGAIYAPPMIVDGIKRHISRITPDFVREVFRRNPLVINLCSPELLYELIQTLCSGTYDDKVWQGKLREAFGALMENAKKAGAAARAVPGRRIEPDGGKL